SGSAFCRMFRPVPEFIAAVMPTTRRSRRTSSTMASPKTWVYCGTAAGAPGFFLAAAGAPLAMEFGLAACHFSMPSRPPSSAGAKPLPLTVAAWTTTGRSAASASVRASRSALTSWPSTTPMYAKSSSSHHSPGAHDVVGRLGARAEWRETPVLADRVELVAAAGQDLVRVGLMADVPDDLVLGRLEQGVQRHRDLACAEVGAEVAADLADGVDDVLADLLGDLLELVFGEGVEVGGTVDARKQLGHEVRVTMKS